MSILKVEVPARKKSIILQNEGREIRIKPEQAEALVHLLLQAMDSAEVDRDGTGALVSVIVKGALERLRDPKNVAKGGWHDLNLDQLESKAIEEMVELGHEIMQRGTRDRKALEAKDVITAAGMYLQGLEADPEPEMEV